MIHKKLFFLIHLFLSIAFSCNTELFASDTNFKQILTDQDSNKPSFKVLVVASADPDHDPMIIKAKAFLEKIGSENNFEVFYTRDATLINDENLAQYQVFVQMHLAPFDMTPPQQAALQHFISRGKGWVGVHAAGLNRHTV